MVGFAHCALFCLSACGGHWPRLRIIDSRIKPPHIVPIHAFLHFSKHTLFVLQFLTAVDSFLFATWKKKTSKIVEDYLEFAMRLEWVPGRSRRFNCIIFVCYHGAKWIMSQLMSSVFLKLRSISHSLLLIFRVHQNSHLFRISSSSVFRWRTAQYPCVIRGAASPLELGIASLAGGWELPDYVAGGAIQLLR